jgi:1-acyl-sn-glycerol-3-phosphate acyltransferase
MTAEIDQIPQASALQQQLDLLNAAILQLQAGYPVTSLTVDVDMNQPSPVPGTPPGPIRLVLNPPISNPTSLEALSAELQTQAATVTQQLVDMGYAQPPVAKWQLNLGDK